MMPRRSFAPKVEPSNSPTSPAQPFAMPMTSWPSRMANPPMARMAAFKPGASPPAVRTPIRTRTPSPDPPSFYERCRAPSGTHVHLPECFLTGNIRASEDDRDEETHYERHEDTKIGVGPRP